MIKEGWGFSPYVYRTQLHHVELVEYLVKSATGGKDALGEASVVLRVHASEDTVGNVSARAKIWRGRGTHEDVVLASAHAIVCAINKMTG